MTGRPIEVWVIADDADRCESVRALVVAQPGMRCPVTMPALEPALVALAAGAHPDVIIDFRLFTPNGVEGIAQGIVRIRALAPSCQLLVVGKHDDECAFEAIRAGAAGYLATPSSATRLIGAIELAVSGAVVMSAAIAHRVASALAAFGTHKRRRPDYGLTAREREILDWLVAGESQKQIARRLTISRHTVDTHMRNLYTKLQVRTRAGAVAKALRDGGR